MPAWVEAVGPTYPPPPLHTVILQLSYPWSPSPVSLASRDRNGDPWNSTIDRYDLTSLFQSLGHWGRSKKWAGGERAFPAIVPTD